MKFSKKILFGDTIEATSGKIKINDAMIQWKIFLFYIYHKDLHKDDTKIIVVLLMAAGKYAIFSGLVNMHVCQNFGRKLVGDMWWR